jgi:uncharacterized protein (TIGR02757 family)
MKRELNLWYRRINRPSFAKEDPVSFPRSFSRPEDREAAAFLASVIAWGRRDLILRSGRRMFALMGESPFDFVMSGSWKPGASCVHRTFFEKDLAYFCRGLRWCFEKYGSLEKLFTGGIWEGIDRFRGEMAAANGGVFTKHIANPAISACKRLNLALRWLVRSDAVDMGLWKNVSPSALFIPLDLHVARTARRLGLLERGSGDRKAVVELTEKLRAFCPEDPVKYDFALFGMGVADQSPDLAP